MDVSISYNAFDQLEAILHLHSLAFLVEEARDQMHSVCTSTLKWK
jgi:hypothetical protein